MTKEPFATYQINNFEEFENTIIEIRRNRPSQFTVFRGQGSSEWGLVPSLFRSIIKKPDLNDEDLKKLYEEEFNLVADFVRSADRMGFSLPGNLFPFLNFTKFESIRIEHWAIFCDPSFIETIAIAQHHSVPTRLLDFTYEPYTALYFAAKSCFDLNHDVENPTGFFSLWMIDGFYLRVPDCKIKMIHAASSDNRYLNAQKALFLSLPSPFPSLINNEGKTTSERLDLLHEIVEDNKRMCLDGPGHANILPVIIRFDFSSTMSADFLRKLDSRDINIKTVMPNLDNIMRYNKNSMKVNKQWNLWTPFDGKRFNF